MKGSRQRREWTRREFLAAGAATGAGLALGGCSAPGVSISSRPTFDLIVRGGTLLDGTGAAARTGSVGVRDGRITALGEIPPGASASRVIDASGLHVCPGFVDIHSHVDTSLIRDPRAESKVRQGVTTEASGMDGSSAAPLGGPELGQTLEQFRTETGFECPYRDMDGYLSLLERQGTAQNLVTYVGLGTIREVVVGLDDRRASSDEMERMRREVRRAIEQGARGVSTGLEYTPGSFASSAELAQVVAAAPEPYRVYATHMRNESDTLLEAIGEAIGIARDSGARLQVSHLKAQNRTNWPKQREALDLLEKARRDGMDVHADRYPYLAYSTDLTALFPLWSRDGGTEKFLARLQDPGTLARIREAVLAKVEGLGSWESVMITSVVSEEAKLYQGQRINEIASLKRVDPFDFTVDLLLREKARVGMVGFGMNEEGTEMVLAWEYAMVASDAGAYAPSRSTSRPHPRAYGTFPRAIAVYQKERKIVTLPEMIRKMTSLPAMKLGLADRGVLAVGKAADLVIFDERTIRDRATYVDPHQFPDGIPWVIVNGVPVVDGGKQTDALPGRILRST